MNQQLPHVKGRNVAAHRDDAVLYFDCRTPGDGRAQGQQMSPQPVDQLLVRRKHEGSIRQVEFAVDNRRRVATSAVATRVSVQMKIAGGSGTTVVPLTSPSTWN